LQEVPGYNFGEGAVYNYGEIALPGVAAP
jgi:hypothetical protein